MSTYSLVLKNLSVKVGNKLVVKNVSFTIPPGETHALLGPNGSGKSSLLGAIMGLPEYEIAEGKILWNGKDITHLSVDERAKLGVGLMYQRPPPLRGVKIKHLLRYMSGKIELKNYAELLKLPMDYSERDLNVGFSGGELKKLELLQLMVQNPKLVLLDEPDSGVDVENLKLIGEILQTFLQNKTALVVTHFGHILQYLHVGTAHVLINGELICSEDPKLILHRILSEGYKCCLECAKLGRRVR